MCYGMMSCLPYNTCNVIDPMNICIDSSAESGIELVVTAGECINFFVEIVVPFHK